MRSSQVLPRLDRVAAVVGLVGVVVLAPPSAQPAEQTEEVTRLEVQLAPGTGREGTVVTVTRIDTVAEAVDSRSRPWRGEVLGWTVPRGSRWRVEAARDGLWAAPTVVTADAPRVRVPVLTHPTGRVTGRVSVPEGESVPDRLGVRFQTVPREGGDRPKTLDGTVRCPIRGSRFECELPAGLFDLRLRAATFVSHYRWGLRVEAGGETALGGLTLEPGASVVGWVEPATGRLEPDRCRVELEPAPARGTTVPSREAKERWAALTLSARPDERGFVHFQGVPPGQYALVATHPGLAPARRAPIPVSERSETTLAEPVVLHPPEDLEVSIDPATDPAGEPWSLRLERIDPFSGAPERIAEVEVPPDGWLLWDDLALGEYVLTVRDRTGATHLTQSVRLEWGSGPVRIEVPVVRVRGRVLLGKEPLPADLAFVHPVRGSRLRLTTDEDGEFEGTVASEGEWNVLVINEERDVRQTLSGVEVEAGEETGWAHVELRLPATRLRGEVVDEQGAGTPASLVVMTLGERPMGYRTEEDGSFELVGLAAGQVQIVAETADGRRSEYRLVELMEDLEPPPVRMVVRERVRLVGEVLSPEGPVPGARLDLLPASAPTGFFETVVTDVRGEFQADLPPGTSEVAGVLEAPGFALRAFRTAVDPRSPLTLLAERAGGSVRIELPEALGPAFGRPHELVVFQDGNHLPVLSLRRWSRFNGGASEASTALSVPRVVSGRYAACLVPTERLLGVLMTGPGAEGACAVGYLAPGGELTLKVPASKAP